MVERFPDNAIVNTASLLRLCHINKPIMANFKAKAELNSPCFYSLTPDLEAFSHNSVAVATELPFRAVLDPREPKTRFLSY